MGDAYRSLSHTQLSKGVAILSPPLSHGAVVSLESPAISAMTDLSQVRPITVDSFASIKHANDRMIAYGVRLLFVASTDEHMSGIITATDILGEKPVQYMHEVSCTHEEVLVRDIMTPVNEIEVLRLVDVERARVGDIVETLKDAGRQHALVVECDRAAQIQHVCGIFSASHVSRLMNARVEVSEVATSFAAVQSALEH